MQILGLDATKGGWVAVALVDGAFAGAAFVPSATEALARWPDAVAVGIDIPIGLLDVRRDADDAARRALAGRSSTLFTTPCASALACATHAEAVAVQRRLVGVGLSAQSFALKERIEDAVRVAADPRVHEVHPELVFARLAGGPVPKKRSWNGLVRRARLLAAAGVVVPDVVAGGGDHPADDLLDAAAVALSARDVVRGVAPSYPPEPTQVVGGRRVRIYG